MSLLVWLSFGECFSVVLMNSVCSLLNWGGVVVFWLEVVVICYIYLFVIVVLGCGWVVVLVLRND